MVSGLNPYFIGAAFLVIVAVLFLFTHKMLWALPFGGGVEGRVVDDAGLPVQGVRVTATGPAGAAGQAVSERDGRWTLRALPPGSWKLSVQRSGFLTVTRTIAVPASKQRGGVTQREVTLTLARGAVAAGTVRDGRGARVADARVQVRAADGATAEGRTDARGEFRLRDCPTGELELSAEHASGRAQMRLFLRPGQEVATLVLELAP